jgi:hypothetical protein
MNDHDEASIYGDMVYTDGVGRRRRPTRLGRGQSEVDRQVEAQLVAKEQGSEVQRRLALAEKIGDDSYEDGTILRFTKKLAPTSTPYTFAALKAGNGWYLTGAMANPGRQTWLQLVAWLVSGEPIQVLWRASMFEAVHDSGVTVVQTQEGDLSFEDQDDRTELRQHLREVHGLPEADEFSLNRAKTLHARDHYGSGAVVHHHSTSIQPDRKDLDNG